jgi:mRNA degradation ribonuclease J1/J2
VFTESTGSAEEIKSVVKRAVDGYVYEYGYQEELAAVVKKALKNYFYKKSKQSPLIAVSILDV